MKSLKCVKAKVTFWRVLKVVFYMMGIPLLHYFVRLSVQGYAGGYAGSASFALKILNIVWAAMAVIQIVVALIAKTKRVRALIVGIISAVIMCAPIAYIQTVVKADYNATRDAFAEEGYEIERWEELYYDYNSIASDLNGAYSKYLNYYNISYSSDVYGSTNADGSEYEYNAEDDAYYSENGMFADGYVFGYKQARMIQETYYDYRAEHPTADKDLAKAIEKLETNPSSAWNKYKKTEEYQAAYGENGTATKHYITEERLDAILSKIGEEIDKTKLKKSLASAMSSLGGLIPDNIPVDKILNLLNKDLSMSAIAPVIEQFGLSEDQIWELLGNYSFYQSPSTYPVYYFIEDEALKEYAYACYYGKVHGANVGSVLISDTAVGEVTFSSSGNKPMDEEDLREIFDTIDHESQYVSKFMPYFSFLEYLYYFAGVVPCAFFLSYMASEMEKRTFDKYLTLKEGGR